MLEEMWKVWGRFRESKSATSQHAFIQMHSHRTYNIHVYCITSTHTCTHNRACNLHMYVCGTRCAQPHTYTSMFCGHEWKYVCACERARGCVGARVPPQPRRCTHKGSMQRLLCSMLTFSMQHPKMHASVFVRLRTRVCECVGFVAITLKVRLTVG